MGSDIDLGYWHTGSLRGTTRTERHVGDTDYISSVVRRAATSSATSTSTPLGIPTIIGIAVAGFAVVFSVLIAIGCYCARSRYSGKKKHRSRRSLTVEHGNIDVAEALHTNIPPSIPSGRGTPNPPLRARGSSVSRQSKEWTDDEKSDTRSSLRPPSYAFRITGLRDSWPLVSWSKSPVLPIPDELTRNAHNADSSRAPYPLTVNSQIGELTKPPVARSRNVSSTVITDIGPAIRSTHSAKGSISSSKPSTIHRRSLSDNHLTSILRSTSQRLRDSHRRPRSRATSIMSQASGPPPENKAPTPPKDEGTISREGLVDTDQASNYADSVKSSVLNMFSRTPSPGKMIARSAGSGKAKGREPDITDGSDDDSILGKKSVEIVIPAALTSPSKRGGTTERHKIRLSSGDNSPTKMLQDNRMSMVAFGGRDIFADRRSVSMNSSDNDPFVSPSLPLKRRSVGRPIGARPPSQRKSSFGLEPSIELSDVRAPSPLRVVSGNPRSPTRGKRASTADEEDPNPFQWSPQMTKTSVDSNRPQGIKKAKGHKRSQTVRVTGLPRTISNISIVAEEPENETNSPYGSALKPQANIVEDTSPALSFIGSPISDYSGSQSVRPPSTSTFQPFLTLPSTHESGDTSSRTSQASYPLSVYDYYSTVDTSALGLNFGPSPSASPTPSPSPPASPSIKKTRRHGRNFSIETTSTNFSQPLPNQSGRMSLSKTTTPLLLPPSTNHSFIHPSASPPPLFSSSKTAPQIALPSFNSDPMPNPRLHGPRQLPQPPARESIAHSVGILRRMNSELSTYSTVSTGSVDSPTLPALRGGGSPPSKKNRGSKNYLKMGSSASPTPPRRGSPGKSKRYQREKSAELGNLREEGAGEAETMAMGTIVSKRVDLNREVIVKKTSPIGVTKPRERRNRNYFAVIDPSPPPTTTAPSPPTDPLELQMPVLEQDGSPSPTRVIRTTSIARKLSHRRSAFGSERPDSSWAARNIPKDEYYHPEGPLSLGNANLQLSSRGPDVNNEQTSDVHDAGTPSPTLEKWENHTPPSLHTKVRAESQIKMPSPQTPITGPGGVGVWGDKWRKSLGLYDENGFLRSSPVGGSPLR